MRPVEEHFYDSNMLFATFDFFAFFLIVFAVQLMLPHRARNLFLLAASCFFYGCWSPTFLGLMWITILTDFLVGYALGMTENPAQRKLLVAVSCVVNFSILGYFKYVNFFADTIIRVLQAAGSEVPAWSLDVVLPVGISFYTFQSMSYTIDVYRRQMAPLRDLADYALYVTLFPQLVAGPIERGTHLAAQIRQKTPFRWSAACDGSWLILKGLVKKTVLADNLAPIVDRIFNLSHPTGPEVLLGVYAFAFQIYGDFSGYTDIARGVGKWLGYDLMLNFRLPYLAIDPSDFWRRWHISLSTWLRDYLYIPLGGNRAGVGLTCRNLMITMMLGGLWHGARWTFVCWGLFHGVILVLFRLSQEWRQQDTSPRPPTCGQPRWWLSVIVMFHLTCFGWLLFRAADLQQVATMLAQLRTGWTNLEMTPDVWTFLLLAIPVMTVQLCEERSGNLNFLPSLSVFPRAIVYALALLSILGLGSFGGREFIYFQF